MSVVQIKSLSGAVLFEHDVPDDVTDRTRAALVAACIRRAYLRGADLSGAYLSGSDLSGSDLSGSCLRDADLSGAYLSGADLSGSDLSGSCLSGAYLSGAYLRGADLSGSDLSGSYLSGADLSGTCLRGARLSTNDAATDGACVVQIGPIGSRADYMTVWQTNNGLRVVTGCFYGSDEAFLDAVAKTHGDSRHATDYRAAIAFARVKFGAAQ